MAAAVVAFLEKNGPMGVKIKSHTHHGGGRAVRSKASGQAIKAFAAAFTEVFEAPCEYILEGASIPIVTNLAEACGGEVVLLGLALPDDLIHAPNEHFGVDRLQKGCLVIGRAIQLLANNS